MVMPLSTRGGAGVESDALFCKLFSGVRKELFIERKSLFQGSAEGAPEAGVVAAYGLVCFVGRPIGHRW
jgi:hypothetical protein